MAFNKAKALQEAERSVSQGKFSQAIKDYLDIFQHDPRDLGLLNTVGDLCVRDRNIPEALRVFHRLAGAYDREGFILRAIAIYRKIVKLDANAVDPLVKLAELYAAQGLGREAREQYAQALDLCKRTKQRGKALEVMARIVAAEPENVPHRLRLAELAEAMNRHGQAASAYLDAAEVALQQGDRAKAREAFEKGAALDPVHQKVSSLRGQLAAVPTSGATRKKPVAPTELEVTTHKAGAPSPAPAPVGVGDAPLRPEGATDREPRVDSSAVAAQSAPEIGGVIGASAAPPRLSPDEREADQAAAELEAVSQAMDLSSEWERAAVPAAQPSSPPASPDHEPATVAGALELAATPATEQQIFNYDESRAEIDFYLQSGFFEQARAVLGSLERAFPGNPHIAEFARHVEEQEQVAPTPEFGHAGEPAAEAEAPRQLEPEVPAEVRGPVAEAASGGPLESLSAELAGSFSGLATTPAAAPAPPQEPAAAEEAPVDISASLGAMLTELEEEAREPSPTGNPNTHYDLGVAFREMGLLDEAIGEFQKVVKAAGENQYPPQFLTACSLLGQSFLDKDLPAIAAKWYERALEAPNLDAEAALALHYDLGLACERAGDLQTALQKFFEVYSQNIDYRDVAEKIRLLQQKP